MTLSESARGFTPGAANRQKRRKEWLHVLRRAIRTPSGRIGAGVALVVLAVAFVGPFFQPQNPDAVGVVQNFAKPLSGFPLGGDVLGRDVWSRILGGGREIVILAACATAVGLGVGATAGVAAAYLQGWADNVIMRVVDVVLAFPPLVLALLLVAVAGSHGWILIIAVGVAHAPQVARVIRAAALDIVERDYVKAVAIMGVRPMRLMRQEILPNLMTPLMVEAGLRMTYSIIMMSGLAFLGLGFDPSAPNWGFMINENRIGMSINPWANLAPAALLAALAIGVNLFADAVSRAALGMEREPAGNGEEQDQATEAREVSE